MKYSLNWINTYVPVSQKYSLSELKESIWSGLSEVKSVTELNELYKDILIAKIESLVKHPRADKLQLVTIDLGPKGKKIIVTGAQNIKVGDLIPYLPIGAIVPNTVTESSKGLILEAKEFFDVVSEGMLASGKELEITNDHSGILILEETDFINKAQPGDSFANAVGLNDTVLEIENKSMTHRGDCFSIIGMAHEIAALSGTPFNKSPWLTPSDEVVAEYTKIAIDHSSTNIRVDSEVNQECIRFSTIALENITVKKSPLWLQVVLFKHGIASVNNVVDITNFVMLEWGQPLHAYDQLKIGSNDSIHFMIRKARAGEKIIGLDKKEHILDDKTLVIANESEILGIAGIMGGIESGVSGNTTKIIIEAATFDMYDVRRSSMRHGLFTDASTVFSRKQDPSKTIKALLYATKLLMAYAGGKVASELSDFYPNEIKKPELIISLERVRGFIGTILTNEEIVKILGSFAYTIKRQEGDTLIIIPPQFRTDIVIDEDVYEDIVRISGYKNILPVLPQRSIYSITKDPMQQLIFDSREIFSRSGLAEAYNFNFIDGALYKSLNIEINDCIRITNAISPEVQFVRKLLLPGLIKQVAENQFNSDYFGLFEYGKVTRKTDTVTEDTRTTLFPKDDYGLPSESRQIALSIYKKSGMTFYNMKSQVVNYLQNIGLQSILYMPINELSEKQTEKLPLWVRELLPVVKTGRAALIMCRHNKEVLGIIGEVSLRVTDALGINGSIAIAELSLDTVLDQEKTLLRYIEPSKFPSFTKDYTYEVDITIAFDVIDNEIKKQLRENKKHILCYLSILSIFHISERDKKRITFRTIYQAPDRTLSDKDIIDIEVSVKKVLSEQFSAELI